MYFVVFALLVAAATAAPQEYESSGRPDEVVPILRYDKVQEDDGRYSLDVQTGNDITISQSGTPGKEGAVVKAGKYSYVAPDGTPVSVTFVADENGFQPQSDVLPVAPAFPHEIPQFVLDQITYAAQEDANAPRYEERK